LTDVVNISWEAQPAPRPTCFGFQGKIFKTQPSLSPYPRTVRALLKRKSTKMVGNHADSVSDLGVKKLASPWWWISRADPAATQRSAEYSEHCWVLPVLPVESDRNLASSPTMARPASFITAWNTATRSPCAASSCITH